MSFISGQKLLNLIPEYTAPCGVCRKTAKYPGRIAPPMEASDPDPVLVTEPAHAYESVELTNGKEQPFKIEHGIKARRKRKLSGATYAAAPDSQTGTSSPPSAARAILVAKKTVLPAKVPPLTFRIIKN